MSIAYTLAIVAVMALVTYIIRAFPFILFGLTSRVPRVALYLGKTLSPAAIAMLVVYCYREVDMAHAPFGAWELLSGLAVVLLHLLWKNPLLSIAGGTVLYMILIRL